MSAKVDPSPEPPESITTLENCDTLSRAPVVVGPCFYIQNYDFINGCCIKLVNVGNCDIAIENEYRGQAKAAMALHPKLPSEYNAIGAIRSLISTQSNV